MKKSENKSRPFQHKVGHKTNVGLIFKTKVGLFLTPADIDTKTYQ